METKTFKVPNISCGHCTKTIEMEVGELEGVAGVQAEQQTKQVTVSWQAPASWEQIEALLRDINYPPEQLLQIN